MARNSSVFAQKICEQLSIFVWASVFVIYVTVCLLRPSRMHTTCGAVPTLRGITLNLLVTFVAVVPTMKLQRTLTATLDSLGGIALLGSALALSESWSTFGVLAEAHALQAFGVSFTLALAAFASARVVQLATIVLMAPKANQRRAPTGNHSYAPPVATVGIAVESVMQRAA